MTRARAWLRVSTQHQDQEQQLAAVLRRVAYGDRGEPWAFDAERGIYRARGVSRDDEDAPERREVFGDAKAGRFDVLVVWALDRWTGAGILALLLDVERLKKCGVRLVSVQEEWAENELLLSIAAWGSQQELQRKRQRARMAVEDRVERIKSRGGFWSKAGNYVTKMGRPAKIDRARALELWEVCARKGCGRPENEHSKPGAYSFAGAGACIFLRPSIGAVARAVGCSRSYLRDHILKKGAGDDAAA